YPTFNVADIHITVGVVLILLDGFAEGRRERARLLEAGSVVTPAAAAEESDETNADSEEDAQQLPASSPSEG
ncbi:MAG: hypothetical protein KBB95_05465, partial [Deltaproteobacteria bacterium]|nr:hypothetical protein [Deltaproteobacteria bacterium]